MSITNERFSLKLYTVQFIFNFPTCQYIISFFKILALICNIFWTLQKEKYTITIKYAEIRKKNFIIGFKLWCYVEITDKIPKVLKEKKYAAVKKSALYNILEQFKDPKIKLYGSYNFKTWRHIFLLDAQNTPYCIDFEFSKRLFGFLFARYKYWTRISFNIIWRTNYDVYVFVFV